MQYRPDFDKVKCLEVTVSKGQAIYIPATGGTVFNMQPIALSVPSSIGHTIAILPRLCMSFLQKQNGKHKVAQEIDVSAVVKTSAEQPETNDLKLNDYI